MSGFLIDLIIQEPEISSPSTRRVGGAGDSVSGWADKGGEMKGQTAQWV